MSNTSDSSSALRALSAWEASAAMARGDFTSEELTQAFLDGIAQSKSNSYISLNPLALEQAQASDQRRLEGGLLGPLDGVPMALKDNILYQGLRNTCASRMLDQYVAPYSATVARRLDGSGCILLGKLNMDEFAMGSSSETSFYGPVRNPHNLQHIAGGSSGGSAAAVAEDLACFTLGTDTGGSIRQPASMCGVWGLKPTYGRVSRYGVVAFASSLDQVGPLTKNARDAALVLEVIAGEDPYDGSSLNHGVEAYSKEIEASMPVLKVGIPQEYMGPGIAPEIRQKVMEAARILEEKGASVQTCSLPRLSDALSVYYVISSAEACSNLSRFDGVKYGHRAKHYEGLREMIEKTRDEGFGAEVKRRILLGTYTLSAGYYDAYYKRAQQARTLIISDFHRAFETYDLLLAPTSPVTAWPLGQPFSEPTEVYAMDLCTVSVNVAGLPALSLPFGVDQQGLPIGVQLIGPALQEGRLLQVGHTLSQALQGGGQGGL